VLTLLDLVSYCHTGLRLPRQLKSNSRLLAQHPAVQRRLRHECSTVAPNDSPTREDLKKMKYLHNVLREGVHSLLSIPLSTL